MLVSGSLVGRGATSSSRLPSLISPWGRKRHSRGKMHMNLLMFLNAIKTLILVCVEHPSVNAVCITADVPLAR